MAFIKNDYLHVTPVGFDTVNDDNDEKPLLSQKSGSAGTAFTRSSQQQSKPKPQPSDDSSSGDNYVGRGDASPFRPRKSFVDKHYLAKGKDLIASGMDIKRTSKQYSSMNRSMSEQLLEGQVDLSDNPRDKGNVSNIALASKSVIPHRIRKKRSSSESAAKYEKISGTIKQYHKASDWGKRVLPTLPVTRLHRESSHDEDISNLFEHVVKRSGSSRTLPPPPPPPKSSTESRNMELAGIPIVTDENQEKLDTEDNLDTQTGQSLPLQDSNFSFDGKLSGLQEDHHPHEGGSKTVKETSMSVKSTILNNHNPLRDSQPVDLGLSSTLRSGISPSTSTSNVKEPRKSAKSNSLRKSLADVLLEHDIMYDAKQMKPYPGANTIKCAEAAIKASESFGPSNFGTMEFDNFNSAWFIRVQSQLDGPDTPTKIISFIADQLKYPLPRLLISVTGGAKDFELTSELEQVLKRGLRKAAEATNAWVITGGSDCGIMKYVGQAMADIDSGMAAGNQSSSGEPIRIPVIGVASFGVLAAQNVLRKGGPNFNFTKYNNDPSATASQDVGLDKNHKVFILYDNGSKGTFGTETRIRARIEETLVRTSVTKDPESKHAMFRSKKVFPVCLVVEGGPVTLDVVEAAVESNTPVVVIEGSGRMADVIAYAWRYLNDTSPESRYLTLSGLRSKIRRVIPQTNEQVLKKQVEVLRLVLQATQITIYSLEDDIKEDQDIDGVDHALLKAIIRSLKIKPVDSTKVNRRNAALMKGLDRHSVGLYNMYQTKLFLAMMFNKVEAVNDNLVQLRAITRDAKSSGPRNILHLDLEDCLLWALCGQRSEFTKMLCRIVDISSMLRRNDNRALDQIFKASNNPTARNYLEVLYEWAAKRLRYNRTGSNGRRQQQTLYRKLLTDQKNDKRNRTISRRNASDIRRTSIFDSAGISGTDSVNHRTSGGQRSGIFEDLIDFKLVRVINHLVGRVLLGKSMVGRDDVFHIIGRSVKDDIGRLSNAPEIKLNKDRAYQDLLVWAVLTSREELAHFFWSEGGNSIATALFASTLCGRLATCEVLARHGHFRDVIHKMKRMSKIFEELAIGVLDMCYNENSSMSQTILRLELGHLHMRHHSPDFNDCISMAFAGRKLQFISHPACLALIEREWMGEIDPMTSKFWIFVTAVFPILLWQSSVGHIQFRGDAITSLFGNLGEDAIERSASDLDLEDEEFDGGDSEEIMINGLFRKGANRFALFYRAPYVKFCLDIVSFAVLVVLYLYTLLHFSNDELDSSEIVLLCWMTVISVEELGQCAVAGLGRWWREHWNKLEFFMYFFYWLGFVFRLIARYTEPPYSVLMAGWHMTPFFYMRVAKAFAAMGVILLLGRIMRFYLYSRVIGPKIVMLMSMMVDIGAFLAMLFVAILTYGASTEALRPLLVQNGSGVSWWRMFFRPYFQIYGELYIEEVSAETECIGVEPFQNCGSSFQELIMILTAIYFFVTNIVLINLLIATMARRFDEIQSQAVKVWRYQQYDLLKEYEDKSKLPNPFSIVSSFLDIFEGAKRRWNHVKDEDSSQIGVEEEVFYRQLESFQEKNTERFLESVTSSTVNSDSARIARLEMSTIILRNGVRELHTQTQRLDNRIYRTHEAISHISRWLSTVLKPLVGEAVSAAKAAGEPDTPVPLMRLGSEIDFVSPQRNVQTPANEDLMDPIAGRVNITKHLGRTRYQDAMYPVSPDRLFGFYHPHASKLQKFKTSDGNSIFFATHGMHQTGSPDDKLMTLFEEEWPPFCDRNKKIVDLRRPRIHSGSELRRHVVPKEFSEWSVEYPEYDPPEYTAPYVYCFGPGSPAPGFKWAHDPDPKVAKIAESAHEVGYDNDGRPLNPLGRVGIRGRGLLGKWGPNLAIDQVVTRWKRNENQTQVERRGKPILEVVLCKRTDTGEWALPGGFQGMDDGVNPVIRKVFGLEPDQVQDNEDLQEVEAILKNSKLFFKGLTCDPRDTDNAWVESSVMHVHDDTNILSKYEMTEGANPAIKFVSWATIHKDMVMFANHQKILEKIVEQMNALW